MRDANGPSSATGANRSFRSGFEADYCWSNNNDRDAEYACVRVSVRTHDARMCTETMTACDDFWTTRSTFPRYRRARKSTVWTKKRVLFTKGVSKLKKLKKIKKRYIKENNIKNITDINVLKKSKKNFPESFCWFFYILTYRSSIEIFVSIENICCVIQNSFFIAWN